jgi:hypothetical protein
VEVTVDDGKGGVRITINGDSSVVRTDRVRPRIRVGSGSDDDVVAMGHDVTIKPDEIVHGDAVSIMGDVQILGRVEGDAVSIGGQVDLGPGAVVDGDAVSVWGSGIQLAPGSVVAGEAVVLGGRIEEAPGARVGQRVQIGFLPAFKARQPFFLRSGWITFLLHVIVIGLIGWALAKVFGRRWIAAVATLRARAGESLLAGLGAGILYVIAGLPLLVVVALVLVAVVVGIPLVPVVLLLILLLPLPGYCATAMLLGESVRGRTAETAGPPGEPDRGTSFLVGHLLLSVPWLLAVLLRSAMGAWFSLAGVFLLITWGIITLAVAFGWGAFLLSRLGTRMPVARGVPQPGPAAPPAP